jgi:hypothetical protein
MHTSGKSYNKKLFFREGKKLTMLKAKSDGNKKFSQPVLLMAFMNSGKLDNQYG